MFFHCTNFFSVYKLVSIMLKNVSSEYRILYFVYRRMQIQQRSLVGMRFKDKHAISDIEFEEGQSNQLRTSENNSKEMQKR